MICQEPGWAETSFKNAIQDAISESHPQELQIGQPIPEVCLSVPSAEAERARVEYQCECRYQPPGPQSSLRASFFYADPQPLSKNGSRRARSYSQ
jgi:hypothetical protein